MTTSYDDRQHCPCGSQRYFNACCGPLLYANGSNAQERAARPRATSAEQLMRSRYSAFALGLGDYLLNTTHPSKRHGLNAQDLSEQACTTQWLGLSLHHSRGTGLEAEGEVSFTARFMEKGCSGALHETSRFLQEEGHWYYLDGQVNVESSPAKAGRNAPCPCGSGKKYKRCCAR